MKVDLAPGWKTELDHGPEWLFIRLYGPEGDAADATGVAESIELMMQQELVHRVIVELEHIESLPADLLQEFVALHKRLDGGNGIFRLCGLIEPLRDVLQRNYAARCLSHFDDRQQAIMGSFRPGKPR